MRLRGLTTARIVAKWIHKRFGRPGPLILGYHRIAECGWDLQRLCVGPQHFAEQLEELMRVGRPIGLAQFMRKFTSADDLSRNFVITFDDGYKDTYDTAAPILERFGVPATVFIPTGMIGRPFWWDEIQEIVENAAELPVSITLELGGAIFQWKRGGRADNARAMLVDALCSHFRNIPYGRTDEALETLREFSERPETNADPVRAMTADEIASLSRHELIDIGSHTVTHRSLNGLARDSQESELRQSKADLEALCGRPIESFAYPNGRISGEAPKLLRDLGFSCGLTSDFSPVSRRNNPYLLPRIFVGDWDGHQFSTWLDRWLG